MFPGGPREGPRRVCTSPDEGPCVPSGVPGARGRGSHRIAFSTETFPSYWKDRGAPPPNATAALTTAGGAGRRQEPGGVAGSRQYSWRSRDLSYSHPNLRGS